MKDEYQKNVIERLNVFDLRQNVTGDTFSAFCFTIESRAAHTHAVSNNGSGPSNPPRVNPRHPFLGRGVASIKGIKHAVGTDAVYSETTAHENTAIGYQALYSTTVSIAGSGVGNGNTGTGFQSLYRNTSGANNTATGFESLYHNKTGAENAAVGWRALFNNSAGSRNIALGAFAGYSVTGDYNIDIGNNGHSYDNNTIRIGTRGTHTAIYIAGIRGVRTTYADAVPVVIDSHGQLGTKSSSARFKDEIKPMDKASEAVLALKPVKFHYNGDSTKTPQFGLIAEEVAKVNPDVVVRDEHGEIYTVRYDAVNAMLLNEFLKEHQKVEEQGRQLQEQKAMNAELRSALAAVNDRLKEQDAKIDKVSAQLATNRLPPRLADNPATITKLP